MFRYSFFLIFFFLFSCKNISDNKVGLINNPISSDNSEKELFMPIIEFDYDSYDFGEINQGEFIDIEYNLKNTGNAPLLIRNAKGSCGCTVPDWPKNPVNAGSSAIIKVRFNSEGKKGYQNKKVTLITNALPSTRVLTIKGNIINNKI
tara:strand:+ start:255 stop:698 length:444 start_codon:yes stop_codon:yes gene_type:complete